MDKKLKKNIISLVGIVIITTTIWANSGWYLGVSFLGVSLSIIGLINSFIDDSKKETLNLNRLDLQMIIILLTLVTLFIGVLLGHFMWV